MNKCCLNCARFHYAWWDEERKFPFCSELNEDNTISADSSFGIEPDDYPLNAPAEKNPLAGGDCIWMAKP